MRRHLGVAAVFALGVVAGLGCGSDQSTPMSDPTDATSESRAPVEDRPASDADADADAPASSGGSPAQGYEATVAAVTAEDLGASWTEGVGCAPPEDLVAVTVAHHGFDGAVHEGRLVVARSVADDVAAVFADLFAAGFPIERMEPVASYGGDDDASMAANNSSGYNCRVVAGTSTLSKHALGLAIDINPLVNPWVHDGRVDPPAGADHVDRTRTDPGLIHADDVVVRAFAARDWSWGGDWNEPDYQHFYVGD